jgi:catechol 2,3-dioxygenase-like lactoylglutathione lyase family enzyme
MKNDVVQIEGIDHVVLRVTNIERSLKFYVGLLGLSLERVIEDFGIYQVRCGRNLIDLMVLPPGVALAGKQERGIDHLCLTIRGDMDEIIRHLKSNNVELSSPVREIYGATGFGTSVYVLDPDQHTIELKGVYSQYPVKTTGPEALKTMTRPAAKA